MKRIRLMASGFFLVITGQYYQIIVFFHSVAKIYFRCTCMYFVNFKGILLILIFYVLYSI